jgi:hypothetical protein
MSGNGATAAALKQQSAAVLAALAALGPSAQGWSGDRGMMQWG